MSKNLATKGANVLVIFFNNEASVNMVISGIIVHKETDQFIGNAISIQANVSDSERVSGINGKVHETFDHVDILVHNVMIGQYFLKPFYGLNGKTLMKSFMTRLMQPVR